MSAPKEEVYTLAEPVEFGKETITEVTIQRKLKHLRGFGLRAGSSVNGDTMLNIDFGTLIDLACKMIAQPLSVMEEMCEQDQSYLIGAAQDFLMSRLGTGKAQ